MSRRSSRIGNFCASARACRPRRTSGPELQWILENVEGVRAAAEKGEAVFGNVDTWVIWNLTGGTDGGGHVTDVTNASRTLLMDLRTLDWDAELLALFGIPRRMLPAITSSSERHAYGMTRRNGPVGAEVPVWAISEISKPQP